MVTLPRWKLDFVFATLDLPQCSDCSDGEPKGCSTLRFESVLQTVGHDQQVLSDIEPDANWVNVVDIRLTIVLHAGCWLRGSHCNT